VKTLENGPESAGEGTRRKRVCASKAWHEREYDEHYLRKCLCANSADRFSEGSEILLGALIDSIYWPSVKNEGKGVRLAEDTCLRKFPVSVREPEVQDAYSRVAIDVNCFL
jgi:hypothetical protein